MRASFYRAYAARLASWGFMVLQYDVPFLTTLPDTPEVGNAFVSTSPSPPDLHEPLHNCRMAVATTVRPVSSLKMTMHCETMEAHLVVRC